VIDLSGEKQNMDVRYCPYCGDLIGDEQKVQLKKSVLCDCDNCKESFRVIPKVIRTSKPRDQQI